MNNLGSLENKEIGNWCRNNLTLHYGQFGQVLSKKCKFVSVCLKLDCPTLANYRIRGSPHQKENLFEEVAMHPVLTFLTVCVMLFLYFIYCSLLF